MPLEMPGGPCPGTTGKDGGRAADEGRPLAVFWEGKLCHPPFVLVA